MGSGMCQCEDIITQNRARHQFTLSKKSLFEGAGESNSYAMNLTDLQVEISGSNIQTCCRLPCMGRWTDKVLQGNCLIVPSASVRVSDALVQPLQSQRKRSLWKWPGDALCEFLLKSLSQRSQALRGNRHDSIYTKFKQKQNIMIVIEFRTEKKKKIVRDTVKLNILRQFFYP